MYKKLILAMISISGTLAAEAADQANPATVQTAAPAQADEQRRAGKTKPAKPTPSPAQPMTELEPVVVTSPLQAKLSETAAPVTVLSDDELIMKMGHSIGETLKQELGITSQSFGPGVGTPVIRGQSGPRVRVLQNGIGSNDVSQLSPDHATSIEPIMADKIEVLRGPATLLYGSGAMGGVVNVIDNRIPGYMPSKLLGGAVEQRYDSVADESSTALKADGGKGILAFHFDGMTRDRGSMSIGGAGIDANAAQALDPSLAVIQNPHGFLPNTYAHTFNGSTGFSLVGDPGFAGVSVNHMENNYGIAPDGSGVSNTRIDIKQSKYDFKSELKQPFSFAETLRTRLGYTDYRHAELDGGLNNQPFKPGTGFTNKTYEGRVELTHNPIGPFKGAVGFQAVSSEFAAFDFTGAQTIVPTSQINGFGVFGMESFNSGPLLNQFGARVEQSSIDPASGTNYSSPNGLPINSSYNYTPISASASSLWKMDASNSLNLALTRSERAPQVQELLSHGFHDATRSFEEGSPNLTTETSYNLDLGYKFKADWMRAEFDLFHNWATNYIYQQRTGQFVQQDPVTGLALTCGSSANCTPVVQSRQGDAIFKGYEAKLVFPVMESHSGLLDLTLFSDYTRGEFVSGGDVPRMPPLRFGLQWDYTLHAWSANVRFTRGEAQTHPGANDTATDGYNLLTLGTQYQIKDFHDTKIMLFAKANNLLNENIRNSVSYLRNFAPEPGRGGELGIRIDY
ncbi:TonB-dependent receptor [Methylomonas paludis]|nr:TonB-dependent receptor [Methylomonas paludis]